MILSEITKGLNSTLRHRVALVTGNLNHFRRIQKLGYELTLLDWRA